MIQTAMVPLMQWSQPQRPQVPRRFTADVHFVSYDPGWAYLPVGYPPAKGHGLFAHDADAKVISIQTIRHFPGMEQLLTNITVLLLQNASYHILGGTSPVCRLIHLFGQQTYSDLFSWAANPHMSEYMGQLMVSGRPCSLWNLRSKNQSKISLCADGNDPVELTITFPRNDGGSFNVSYQFGTLRSQVSDNFIQKPEICDTLAPPCEKGRGQDPELLDAYIFHPAGNYNIEDQDVGDLLGDALFICIDRLQNNSFMDHNYTLISRYALEISPAYGQYALCNGYPPSCVGGDPRLVGRKTISSVGDGESRCAAESPLGFWFSLPKAGRCAAGQRPGADAWATGCSWSIKRRVKTIHQTCLFNQGYLKICMADAVARKGFARTSQALETAFASENPSIGGCPDFGGPDALMV